MVYTLNGPGPLRGLPSLSATDDELGSREVLAVVDRAIERFGLGPGKRFMTVNILGGVEINPMVLRAIKTRGFAISAYAHPKFMLNPALFDALYLCLGPGDVIDILANGAVYNVAPDAEVIEELPVIGDAVRTVRFLQVPAFNATVAQFLREAQYPWTVQAGWGVEVNCV